MILIIIRKQKNFNIYFVLNVKLLLMKVKNNIFLSLLLIISCEVIAYDIDGVYNIVSVNGSPEEEGTPIHPNTLMRNYYEIGEEQSHGTNLSMEEFVMKLYDSVMYWENKAQLA